MYQKSSQSYAENQSYLCRVFDKFKSELKGFEMHVPAPFCANEGYKSHKTVSVSYDFSCDLCDVRHAICINLKLSSYEKSYG